MRDEGELRELLATLGVGPDSAPLLTAYAARLFEWNRSHRFFSHRDGSSPEIVLRRHVVDSLLPVPLFDGEIRRMRAGGAQRVDVYDLGSGPGLPGIPLSIALKSLPGGGADSFHLVERGARRVSFLRYILRDLALDGVVVDDVDFTTLSVRADAPAIVTFRALSPLTEGVVRDVVATFPPGSAILVYQGSEIADALVRTFPGGRAVELPTVPHLGDRSLFRATLPCSGS